MNRPVWNTTLELISRYWPDLTIVFTLAAVFTSAHALLHKRDPRAAALWLGIVWLVPGFGPLLYITLGINRIRRRAVSLGVHNAVNRTIPENFGEPEQIEAQHLKMLSRVVSRVVAQPLMPGNSIQPLMNGDEAFPAMLSAIESAKTSISLCTYIFDNDASGRQFVAALGRAVKRGLKVRVLVDAAGARYSWPSIIRRLRHEKIPCARFLPSSIFAPWRVATINLRNHRKILAVDGRIAFSGGINIRHGNVLAEKPRQPIQDLQFRFTGPVVVQLQEAFVNDWAFVTGEILDGGDWFPDIAETGDVVARVITDGPDADFEKLRWTLLAALAEAQTSVQVVTPYFLPDPAIVTGLNLAALRGVRVDIVLPAKNNLPFVQWASRSMWWQVLERGCRLWLTRPPFDHSKLMIVDGHWVLLGSANWDARSLRLNFELNVECYGRDFARQMAKIVEKKLQGAREVTLEEVDGRPIGGRLLDAATRLFSPFL
ncbi:MAG TPA: phospholipase D-like domain-containing protein [Candidatus Sulfotelmatobacter sp.]|nr:phospholipase D-like domain-containing protein [Candidatus Sulfotelmatobacter sp.]